MKKSSFLIVGKHAVTEALKNEDRNVLRIFLTEDSKKNLNRENQNLNLLNDIKLYYKTKKELDRIKTENYEALEASQTRYQAELEIQRTNFQRQIEKLKAKLQSFEA